MEIIDTLDIDQIDVGDIISFDAADIETDEEFDEVTQVTEIDDWEDLVRVKGHSLRADIEVTYYRYAHAQVDLVRL